MRNVLWGSIALSAILACSSGPSGFLDPFPPDASSGNPSSNGASSGGGGGSSSAADAGTSADAATNAGTGTGAGTGAGNSAPDSGAGTGGADSGTGTATSTGAPTWTQIYTTYLTGSSTLGYCGTSGCHSQMNGSSTAAWTWLSSRGYAGASLVGSSSCLAWFSGGNMPRNYAATGTALETKAINDMNAWKAAGALEN